METSFLGTGVVGDQAAQAIQGLPGSHPSSHPGFQNLLRRTGTGQAEGHCRQPQREAERGFYLHHHPLILSFLPCAEEVPPVPGSWDSLWPPGTQCLTL